MFTVLVIDKDVDVWKRHEAVWRKYDIDSIRVDTVHEAIDQLSMRSDFNHIVINHDTIADLVTLMPLLRDCTKLPIFVLTSNYDVDKRLKLTYLGADRYDHLFPLEEHNVLCSLQCIQTQNRWKKAPAVNLPLISGGNIRLSTRRRRVFIGDIEVKLVKKEYDLLRYFLENNDVAVSHKSILHDVWGNDEYYGAHEIIWNQIHSLRRKLEEASGGVGYIKAIKDFGYRFMAYGEDNKPPT